MHLKLLNFEKRTIRMLIDEQGHPWWSVTDICQVFNIEKARRILQTLDDNDITLAEVFKKATTKVIYVVNEVGLKALLNASSKRGAYQLKEWVEREILPALRTQEMYSLKGNEGFTLPRIGRRSFGAWRQKTENRLQQEKEILRFPASACNENASSAALKNSPIRGNGIRHFKIKFTFDGRDDIRSITLNAPYGFKQLTLLWDLKEKSMRLIRCVP